MHGKHIQYTPYTTPPTLYPLQYTPYSIPPTLYPLHYTPYSTPLTTVEPSTFS